MLGILLGERNEPAVRPPPRRSAGFAVEHQSQQTANLGFPGHELQKDPCEPDRLLGQIPSALVNARHVIPADSEGGINSFQHGVEPLRQFTLLRDFELNAAVADLRLGTHQALPHRRG